MLIHYDYKQHKGDHLHHSNILLEVLSSSISLNTCIHTSHPDRNGKNKTALFNKKHDSLLRELLKIYKRVIRTNIFSQVSGYMVSIYKSIVFLYYIKTRN